MDHENHFLFILTFLSIASIKGRQIRKHQIFPEIVAAYLNMKLVNDV